MNPSIDIKEFRAVRWAFRLLAAFILAMAFLAVTGTVGAAFIGHAYMTGKGASPRLLATLPAIAWMLNVTWSAAVHGRSPRNEHWPFASDRVLTAYVVALYFLLS